MLTETNHETIRNLIAAAYEKRVLQIGYYAPMASGESLRRIEPYAVIETGGTTMLKAFQLTPQEGWRLFNTELIGSVVDSGQTFQPRRPIVMRENGNVKHIAPAESRDYEQIEYERLLQSLIVDLHVAPADARQLAEFRNRYGLTAEELRGSHYRIFSDCLAAVTKDHLVTDEERHMLIELNNCLRECGAGLIQ